MTEPLNALEGALFETLERRATMTEFLAVLTASQIVIPSETQVQTDGSGLAPLSQWREGVELILVFTDPARIGNSLHADAPWQLKVDAAWLIKHLAFDRGLLLLAGPEHGLMLTPAQLANLRARL
jgi:hypothetical protein